MYTSEMVEVWLGGTIKCGIVHVPVSKNELCFENTKIGFVFIFELLKQSNKDENFNLLRILNKSILPVTI